MAQVIALDLALARAFDLALDLVLDLAKRLEASQSAIVERLIEIR